MRHVIFIINNRGEASNMVGIREVFNGKTNNFVKKFLYEHPEEFISKWQDGTKCLKINMSKVEASENMPVKFDELSPFDFLLVDDRVLLSDTNSWKFLFNCEKETTDTNNVAIVWHANTIDNNGNNKDTTSEDAKVFLEKDFCISLEASRHIPDENPYNLLWPLFDSYQEEGTFDTDKYLKAKEQIFSFFESKKKLNRALIVLHKCLTEKPTCESEEITNLKATLTEENVSSLKKSYDNLASPPMAKIESFIAFRDELLKIAI